MNRRTWTGWILMAVLALVAVGALALVNALTGQPPEEQSLASVREELMALFPEADPGGKGFVGITLPQDSPLDFACQVQQGDTLLGYGAASTVRGYAGPVRTTVGLEPDGKLRGILVGNSDFVETQGVGSKVQEEDFRDQFQGKTPPLTLGEDVQAVSGATITSRAVLDGANRAAEALWQTVGAPVPPQAAQPSRTVSASVMGYGGPVLAQVALDEAGAITALQVGKARFLETEGVGSKVKEEAFTSLFLGKKPPLTLGADIDAVSGATVSSQAVVDAVNAAVAFLKE